MVRARRRRCRPARRRSPGAVIGDEAAALRHAVAARGEADDRLAVAHRLMRCRSSAIRPGPASSAARPCSQTPAQAASNGSPSRGAARAATMPASTSPVPARGQPGRRRRRDRGAAVRRGDHRVRRPCRRSPRPLAGGRGAGALDLAAGQVAEQPGELALVRGQDRQPAAAPAPRRPAGAARRRRGPAGGPRRAPRRAAARPPRLGRGRGRAATAPIRVSSSSVARIAGPLDDRASGRPATARAPTAGHSRRRPRRRRRGERGRARHLAGEHRDIAARIFVIVGAGRRQRRRGRSRASRLAAAMPMSATTIRPMWRAAGWSRCEGFSVWKVMVRS